ncbi:MAG: hypothetical protein LW707_08395 [Sphingobacteriales bacterium]|jgi:hypothetical protein|nr:hypothetical protein [Sphingobacteriales bacterium]
MQEIEPFYNWRHLYTSAEDEWSPFYGREYSEFEYSNTIYNYYIHPQWDGFGSPTLYMKILYADYDSGFAVLELIGEWNDAIHNDIMLLKRDVADLLIGKGIQKFVLIGENVLNFHGSDDCYYQEWFEDAEDGWVAALNFREHVRNEFVKYGIDYYFAYGGELDEIRWRMFHPQQLHDLIEQIISHRLA